MMSWHRSKVAPYLDNIFCTRESISVQVTVLCIGLQKLHGPHGISLLDALHCIWPLQSDLHLHPWTIVSAHLLRPIPCLCM